VLEISSDAPILTDHHFASLITIVVGDHILAVLRASPTETDREIDHARHLLRDFDDSRKHPKIVRTPQLVTVAGQGDGRLVILEHSPFFIDVGLYSVRAVKRTTGRFSLVDLPKPAIADESFDLWSDRDLESDSDNGPPQKKLKQNIRSQESTLAGNGSNLLSQRESADDHQPTHYDVKQDAFDSDLTLIGDELSTPIVLSDDENDDMVPLIPQYDEVKDVAHKDNSPPPPMIDAEEDTEPAQPTKVVKTDTTAHSPPPTVPLNTLTLTKLYILAETLDMPALCNHAGLDFSPRLAAKHFLQPKLALLINS
jgi:hypothetical protein